jgi:hypothetical protein
MSSTDHQSLESLRQASLNLGVECGWCEHRGVIDGPKLWRVFAIRRWRSEMARVTEHLRCSVCKRRPQNLVPTSDAPTSDPFPKDERGWQLMVRRARD